MPHHACRHAPPPTLPAGFTISPADIPWPWKAVHYANPVAYAFRAAALNELTAPRWTSQPGDLSGALISFFQIDFPASWIWLGMAVLAGCSALYVACTLAAFSLMRPPPTKAAATGDGGSAATVLDTAGLQDVPPSSASIAMHGGPAFQHIVARTQQLTSGLSRHMSMRRPRTQGAPPGTFRGRGREALARRDRRPWV